MRGAGTLKAEKLHPFSPVQLLHFAGAATSRYASRITFEIRAILYSTSAFILYTSKEIIYYSKLLRVALLGVRLELELELQSWLSV